MLAARPTRGSHTEGAGVAVGGAAHRMGTGTSHTWYMKTA